MDKNASYWIWLLNMAVHSMKEITFGVDVDREQVDMLAEFLRSVSPTSEISVEESGGDGRYIVKIENIRR